MGFWSSIFRRSTAISTPTAPRRMQTRRYRAPAASNTFGGFRPTGGHERVPSALKTLSARARDLAHNNPYAKRAVTVLTAHTVGKGIRFSFVGDKAYDAAFFEWANNPALCDHDRRLTLYGHESLGVRMMFEAGNGFAVMREVRDEDTGLLRLTLQAVDPDLVDTGAGPSTPGNEVVSGVEVDKNGLTVGIHFMSAGPSGKSTFVPIDDVVHFYEVVYPGQLLGVPRGSQALLAVDDLAALMAAAIAKARVETCLGIFVASESEDGSGVVIGEDGIPVAGEEELALPEILDTAMVIRGKPGDKMSTIVPSSSGGVIDYMQASLRAVAMSYDVTYAQSSGDLERTSFSSDKSGRLEFYVTTDATREHHVLPQLSKIERRFRAVYEANGGVVSPDLEVTLVPPGRERLEPAKEVLADMTEMNAGLLTFEQACLARGKDYDVQLAALAAERKKMADLGIVLKLGANDLTTALAAVVAAEEVEEAASDNATSSTKAKE